MKHNCVKSSAARRGLYWAYQLHKLIHVLWGMECPHLTEKSVN